MYAGRSFFKLTERFHAVGANGLIAMENQTMSRVPPRAPPASNPRNPPAAAALNAPIGRSRPAVMPDLAPFDEVRILCMGNAKIERRDLPSLPNDTQPNGAPMAATTAPSIQPQCRAMPDAFCINASTNVPA